MLENESNNLNNFSNQNYIKTNKDDINSLENLKSTMQTGFNDNNNIENDNNNYFNSNFNLFSPFGMAGMYMMGGQNTFFDKLFMTLERANYQMYHLCEMILILVFHLHLELNLLLYLLFLNMFRFLLYLLHLFVLHIMRFPLNW